MIGCTCEPCEIGSYQDVSIRRDSRSPYISTRIYIVRETTEQEWEAYNAEHGLVYGPGKSGQSYFYYEIHMD